MWSLVLGCVLRTGEPLASATPAQEVPWLDHEAYPFPSRFLEADGGTLHYVDVGEGPVVLLVHGTPTWSYVWRELIAELSVDHRVIALDHIGFGLSDHPEEWAYDPASHAGNVAALVDALDLRDVALVVHDFGGPIGLRLLMTHEDRIDRVVIMNTWLWAPDRAMQRASRIVKSPVGKALYLQRAFSPRKMIPWASGPGMSWDDAALAPYLGPFPTPASRLSTWRLGVELAGSAAWYEEAWQNRDALAGKPLCFVWGLADPAFGDDLPRWTEAFPEAQVVALEGVGHFLQEEAPQQVSQAVRTFLDATAREGLSAR